jgi:hypothetical protein
LATWKFDQVARLATEEKKLTTSPDVNDFFFQTFPEFTEQQPQT